MQTESFLGQIQAFGFGFNPVGWLPCDGRLLSIAENEVLYTLIGTTYGGDGISTFGIPDLRGRVPIGMGLGNAPGATQHPLGQKAGHEQMTITTAQMPTHTHVFNASGGNFMVSDQPGTSPAPSSTVNTIGAANESTQTYVNDAYNNQTPTIPLNLGISTGPTVSAAGGSMPFENMEPFQTINFCIAIQGIFPSRN